MLEQRAQNIVAGPGQLAAVRSARGLRFNVVSVAPTGFQGLLKRTLDVTVACLALVALAPLFAAVMIAIKLDSPGPIFIAQNRVRQGLQGFRMLKFRSMVVNAMDLLNDLQLLNEATPPLFKMRQDPRITRVGRHLRRLSIDELPQLINVVRGEMSLVGPRPPFAHEVEYDLLRQSIRLQLPPGMTGLWQVSGRSDLSYEEMITLDLRYTREWSILLDLAILCKTPLTVLTGRGAH